MDPWRSSVSLCDRRSDRGHPYLTYPRLGQYSPLYNLIMTLSSPVSTAFNQQRLLYSANSLPPLHNTIYQFDFLAAFLDSTIMGVAANISPVLVSHALYTFLALMRCLVIRFLLRLNSTAS